MWPKNPLGHGAGACMPLPAVGWWLRLQPGYHLPWHWTPWRGGMLSPAPAALLQPTQNFSTNMPAEHMLCVRYTAVTQTRCLVSLHLFCSHSCWAVTLTGISIYILKDIHIYFFSRGRCYVAIISFLSAGARIVCSVRHSSCSVLHDWGIKNDNFSTALISSCLNVALLLYPPWLLVPTL